VWGVRVNLFEGCRVLRALAPFRQVVLGSQ
jgi:hypothetical protein